MPKHGLALWSQIHSFYNGLSDYTNGNVDATTGGAIGRKTYAEAMILELLAE